jgi:signal transduction histidine kinase
LESATRRTTEAVCKRAAARSSPTRSSSLRYQWLVSSTLIAALTLLSVLVGWLLAGRLLRPLHHITETARRLSVTNLHERVALRGPPDELAVLANTFDAMLGRLEASVETQRRFIANAAHELRTPLATQRAAIQIGLDEPSRERVARVREELLVINRRHERLIDGLLVLAQGEHGLETREPVAVDVLVRQTFDDMLASTDSGLAITRHLLPLTIEGDAVLLQRLIHNLFHNAVRYNVPNGYVDVHVTADGALTVRNSGSEIPEHRISEMFEPFRRLGAERTAPRTALV